ncbi:hypothetical protein EDM22_14310 [Agromyces tardus]|jgi:hypothetical protein|uniref:Uncharacterized protein n=1 Tax=Agromyces tardus TaxID=2583849 RepID=A0A3M8A4Z9_9MICO|nr:hypothetical protein [Agromyces tardus]RNB46293.1 hypothetical protein EDM22_14310 [Agromyces tardus]
MILRIRLAQQEADPIGAITAAPAVVIGASVAVAASVGLTFWHRAEINSPAAAILGIVLVAAAGVVASVSAWPSRAPFTAERLWVVVSLAVGGAIAEYVSTLGTDQYLYDDYGPIAIGLLILAVAPFCTWMSLLTAGFLASAVLAILAVGAAGDRGAGGSVVAVIAVNTSATLALAAAAAGYSYAIVAETLAWQRQANSAALQRDADMRAGIARSVQQSRVSLLGREVLPFLAGIMTAERITVADADRARELAEALRRALKAGIESTWLDDLAASVGSVRGVGVEVDDPGGAARELRVDQRSTLTALVSWLSNSGRSAGMTVSFRTAEHSGVITLEARPGVEPPTRRDLERFLAVARSVGMRAETRVARDNVSVEFRYDLE